MKIFRSKTSLQKQCLQAKKQNKSIAIVPTMGYLHDGHLSLIRRVRAKADIVVLTIFVNPTQFGPKEDLDKYPRDHQGDLQKAKAEKVDWVFMPSTQDIYPNNFQTYVEVTKMTQAMCGQSRPTHFRGVTTIVLKLFQIVQPDYAVFGLKDYQQFRVISQMVSDLDLPIKIIGAPIKREKDGLAMSSRNVYLSTEQRKAALALSRSLNKAKIYVQNVSKPQLAKIKKIVLAELKKQKLVELDYFEIRHSLTLEKCLSYQPNKTLLAIAAFVGKTRLIDNRVL